MSRTSKLNFNFDKDKEIWNIWDSANKISLFLDFSKFIPPNLLNQIKGKSQKESYEIICKELQLLHNSPLIPTYLDAVSIAWNSIEEEYFRRLNEITKQPLESGPFTAYLTTTHRCPYSKEEKWFMINFFSSLSKSLLTIGHELMHFHFYEHYFEEVAGKIGFKNAEHLKEALTVLLNLEFFDLWHEEDKGYTKHQELRNFIVQQWNNNKDFEMLLKECIKFITNNPQIIK